MCSRWRAAARPWRAGICSCASGQGPAGPKRRLTERYRFLHALYPQILYEGLPAARRRQLHRRVGESKETAFISRSAEIAAELAVHFEQAGDAPRAVRYLGQAAQNALRRSAGREAADLLTRALEQLQTLPETPERAQQELSLQASLGAALLMSRGYTAPEVKHAYDRAHALSGQAGESPQLFPALFGLFRFELLRGELRTARSIAEQLLRLAQAQPDPFLVPAAQAALGRGAVSPGGARGGPCSCGTGPPGLRSPPAGGPVASAWGRPGGRVPALCRALPCRCSAIRIRRSRAAGKRGPWPKRCPTPLAWWERFARVRFCIRLRRDGQAAQAQAETALALVSEHALPVWGELAALARGWALAEQGQAEEGIAQMRHALGLMQTVGFHCSGPQHLVLPGRGVREGGSGERGARRARRGARHRTARPGSAGTRPSCIDSKGSSCSNSRAGVPSLEREAEAEACFLRAIEIARSQEARLFELRAAMSLARLRSGRARRRRRDPQLAEVYGWFTEGFETKDLQEARALLTTLG